MLKQLTIQNIVLIDKLIVPFKKGLNVLSGETGAGKSILLDALGLALGARSDSKLIKAGATKASVTAEFSGKISKDLISLLDESGIIIEEPLTLRRTINKDGKSRAFICDQPIGINLLKQIGVILLEIHGQFETYGLLNSSTHKSLLDSYAKTKSLKKKVNKAYNEWKKSIKEHKKATDLAKQAKAEEEFLKSTVEELNEISPKENEIEELSIKRIELQNREKIFGALKNAQQLIAGHKGATTSLAKAGKVILRVVDKAKNLSETLDIIDKSCYEIEEANQQLLQKMQDINADESTLEKAEERLFKLRALARKHNIIPEDLHKLQNDMIKRLEAILDQGDKINKLYKNVIKSRDAYYKLATKLSDERKKASKKIEGNIKKELKPLKLDRAFFVAKCSEVDEENWNEDGIDDIIFLASTNPGQEPSPLNKVASGGELARFMLAIKVVMADSDPISTIVFDEIDTGIGGRAASAVGKRLSKLGSSIQVLSVTHSPQISAKANHNLRVEKEIKNKQAITKIVTLSKNDKIDEIARMLSGDKITNAAKKAAIALIDGE